MLKCKNVKLEKKKADTERVIGARLLILEEEEHRLT